MTSSSSASNNNLITLTSNLIENLNSNFKQQISSNNSNNSHLNHPLVNNSQDRVTIESIKSTFSTITTTLNSFKFNYLEQQQQQFNLDNNNQPQQQHILLEKYLALLKENSLLNFNSIQILQGIKERKKLILNRKNQYEFKFPILFSILNNTTTNIESIIEVESEGEEENFTIIKILEFLSNSLGLISFIESSTSTSTTSTTSNSTESIQVLSLGGKVMVLDFDFLPSPNNNLLKIKVSYLLNGKQNELDSYALLLYSLLLPFNSLTYEGIKNLKGEQLDELERNLKEIKKVLKELVKLDELTEEFNIDYFKHSLNLVNQLNTLLPTTFTDVYQIPHSTSFTSPKLIYHISASTLLSTSYAKFIRDPTETTYNKLKKEGVNLHEMEIELEIDNNENDVEGKLSSNSRYFKIILNPPVFITKSLGRQLTNIFKEKAGEDLEMKIETGSENITGEGKVEGGTSLESLLIYGNSTPLPQESIFQIKPDETQPPQNYTLTNAGTVAGFECSEIKFRDVSGLIRILKLLKNQLLINDLIRSSFNLGNLITPSTATATDNKLESSSSRINKKRKLEETIITLDDLFAPQPTLPLPIYLNLLTSSVKPLAINLTFPAPQFSSSSSASSIYPISIIISPSSDSKGFTVEFKGEDERMDRLLHVEMIRKAEKVLGVGRDLGLLIRWICKVLD